MAFRARVERLGAFGVTSVSLIVAERGWPNKMVGGGRVQRFTSEFRAVFAALPARKRDGVEVNGHCRILCFYQ